MLVYKRGIACGGYSRAICRMRLRETATFDIIYFRCIQLRKGAYIFVLGLYVRMQTSVRKLVTCPLHQLCREQHREVRFEIEAHKPHPCTNNNTY